MIKNLLLVGTGGALGSIARYLLTMLFDHLAIYSEIAIFSANAIGSFIIGLMISYAGSGAHLFAAVGFCGGFTTFSTFSAQAFALLQSGQRTMALIYIVGSVVVSILFVWLGILCHNKLLRL